MNVQQRPSLYLAPSVNTTTVVTTTTTTTTYAPIQLPPLPTPSSPKDPKIYPLLHATLPRSLRQFPLVFPGGARATFHDGEGGSEEMPEEEEVVGGKGWRLIRRDESDARQEVGLIEAVERYGRKRSYTNENMMDTIPGLASRTPPRKKVKGPPIPPITTMNAAAPPSPSLHRTGPPSPRKCLALCSTQWSFIATTQHLSTRSLLDHTIDSAVFTLAFLRTPYVAPVTRSAYIPATLPLPVLRTLHSVLTPTLARDFLTLLPPELVSLILSYLPFPVLLRASRVSKSWKAIIDSDPVLWRDLLRGSNNWFGRDSELAFADAIFARRRRRGLPAPNTLPLPHPYKILFKSRHLTRTRWVENMEPKRLTFAAHGHSVVTCLIFSHGRIISASDDHSIRVWCPHTGTLLLSLLGHEGGVWALAAMQNTLVSGSTDRTVRIWDLSTGRCTHIFGGHTSTVRCLAIVKPELIDYVNERGRPFAESLDVAEARDDEYRCYGADDTEIDPSEEDVEDNPYHKHHLEGHDHAVRALAARGRTLVSGSYDCTVRIWDIITGQCRYVLTGHTQKVYSVVLDITRNLACSGSMDGTVRVWNLNNGQCQHTLTGHTSLVGLLGLSPSSLVSAAADSTLRVWDPDTGELRHSLAAHNGAITCFQHDEFKVLSGSDGTLKMWDIRDGSQVRDLLTGIVGVWQVVFEGRWCVAASNRVDATVIDVWDFGNDEDADWEGEPAGALYDEQTDFDEDDEDLDQADIDMDQELPSDSEVDPDLGEDDDRLGDWTRLSTDVEESATTSMASSRGSSALQYRGDRRPRTRLPGGSSRAAASASVSSMPVPRLLPANDETPTRPRTRNMLHRRR
ncbi:Cell division control protein 4 [Grifola frondosa]|uniref:Cell division control protein 4 n=1 Tax=Grifola frondosa TaxID=5627 RepID=A0A1C7LLM3_GRIFR|nr:Cell division control protein 4 [Grifola frondosa]